MSGDMSGDYTLYFNLCIGYIARGVSLLVDMSAENAGR